MYAEIYVLGLHVWENVFCSQNRRKLYNIIKSEENSSSPLPRDNISYNRHNQKATNSVQISSVLQYHPKVGPHRKFSVSEFSSSQPQIFAEFS